MVSVSSRPAGRSYWHRHQEASYCSNMEVVSFTPSCSSWSRVSLEGLAGSNLPCQASLQHFG